jgi:hypothetical protein
VTRRSRGLLREAPGVSPPRDSGPAAAVYVVVGPASREADLADERQARQCRKLRARAGSGKIMCGQPARDLRRTARNPSLRRSSDWGHSKASSVKCLPKANGVWWRAKLGTNRTRDRRNDEALQAAGWTVLRIWEHQPAPEAVEEIRRHLQKHSRRRALGQS